MRLFFYNKVMNICLFTKEEINQPLDIRDRRAEHIIKVLKKKEGESFSAGIIGESAGKATITKIETHEEKSADGKKSFTGGKIYFSFEPETDGKALNPLVMIIGFPRPIQLKRLLRDMAGLGVKEVHLVATELGEKSYLKSDLATSEAGYQMLLEGTEQAASTHVPLLKRHESLKECIDSIKKEDTIFLALDNINPKGSLGDWLNHAELGLGEKTFVAAIGSERGWTENERKLLEQEGFIRLGMGSRVLRTETAATVAGSIILNAMGKL